MRGPVCNGMSRIFVSLAITAIVFPAFAVTDGVETFDGAAEPWLANLDLPGWSFLSWGGTVVPPATATLTGTGYLSLVNDATVYVQLMRDIGPGDFTMDVYLLPEARVPASATNYPDPEERYTFDLNLVHVKWTERLLLAVEAKADASGFVLHPRTVHGGSWSTPTIVDIGIPTEIRFRVLYEEAGREYNAYYGLNGAPATIELVTGEVYSVAAASDRLLEVRGLAAKILAGTDSFEHLVDYFSLSSSLATPTPSGPTPTPTDTPIVAGVRVDEWKDFR